MTFKDVLAKQASPPSSVCSVKKWRDTLAPEDQAEFDAASGNPDVQHAHIHRAMRELGFAAAATAVQRHRTGGCRCDVR